MHDDCVRSAPKFGVERRRYAGKMAFDTPPPDLVKLMAAWEQWETGEEAPGKVLALLKTAGLPAVLKQLAESGWTAAD